MKIKLNNPNIGYSLVIRFPNPNWEIKRARASTINMDFLNLILNVCSKVLLIEYISETSVENISNQIIISNKAWITLPNLLATKSNGISYLYI